MERETKKKNSKTSKISQVPVTALVRWEDRFRGEFNYGEYWLLMQDGRVWVRPAMRDRDGKITYKKARGREKLFEWRQQYGKDLQKMASDWRFMMGNREKGLEMVGPAILPTLVFNA